MDHPLSLVSALIFRQKGKKIQIPWFIFWFVVAMLVNTYCNLPTQLTHGISVAARCGLSATLFLIGGGLSIEVIRKVGPGRWCWASSSGPSSRSHRSP